MSFKKKTLLAVLLLGGGLALAQLYVESVAYYPVVKISAPSGLEFTFVHDAIGNREACAVANRGFVDPIKSECKECKVVYARCERDLKGAELALLQRKALPYYMVSASNMRLMVTGPPKIAQKACEDLALNIIKNGLHSTTCLYPTL